MFFFMVRRTTGSILTDTLLRYYMLFRSICFNAVDPFFAPRKKRVDFSGDLDEWEAWFTAFVAEGGFRQVILFGSGRPIHRVACKAAKAIGVRILSLEEGYIRPGYVTVEPDGNNADSPLAGRLPPEDF